MVKLSFDECKWLLKCYWKVENVVGVQWCSGAKFGTPPTRVTITRIRDKFEVDGTVQDVLKGQGGRGIVIEFPPQFPNLIPLDFYLWGTLKNSVYTTKPQTLEELRGLIELAINDIPLATIRMVCHSIWCHWWECTVAEGGHFEHVWA